MGRQIWEVEDKTESRLVMQDKEGKPGQASLWMTRCEVYFTSARSSLVYWPVGQVRKGCHVAFYSISVLTPNEVAAVAFMHFIIISSYSWISNPPVSLLFFKLYSSIFALKLFSGDNSRITVTTECIICDNIKNSTCYINIHVCVYACVCVYTCIKFHLNYCL